ncbi:MAG: hypothetical protein AAF449_15165, partial [Myxococcota bacterium]
MRHPLKVLSSSVAFGQCVECWALIEDLVVPAFSSSSSSRGGGGDNEGALNATAALTERTRRSILRNRVARRAQVGGREWPQESIDALVEGFGLSWLAWNAMVEPVADYFFRVEDADYAALCELAGGHGCARAAAAALRASANFNTGNHGGASMRVTWGQLAAINPDLERHVWALAHKYGYQRDPPR